MTSFEENLDVEVVIPTSNRNNAKNRSGSPVKQKYSIYKHIIQELTHPPAVPGKRV